MTDSNSPSIITQKQALEMGKNKYFTGIPCKYGHISERYIKENNPTKQGHCCECIHIRSVKQWEKDNYQNKINKENELKEKVKNSIKIKYDHEPKIMSYKEAKNLGLNQYFSGIPCSVGHLDYRWISGGCVTCSTKRSQKNYKTERYLKHKTNNPLKKLWMAARSRAANHGREFSIEIEDLKMGKSCPCCKLDFKFNYGDNIARDRSPSLDRIDSDGGYTKDNIQIICWKCNCLKRDGKSDYLRNLGNRYIMIANYLDSLDKK